MLNNLTNYADLIKLKAIVDVPQDTDLITLGVRNPNYDGKYRPALNTYRDFADSILAQVPVPTTSIKGVHSLIPLSSGEWTSNLIGLSTTTLSNIIQYSEKIVCFPYIPNQTFTVSSLNINVAVAYTAGAVIRLSIYSDLDGKPNELLLNSSDLSANPSGVKTYNATFTFVAGVTYWLGYQTSNANNTGTMSGVAASGSIYIKNNGTFGSVTTKYIFNAPYLSGAPTSLLGVAYTVDSQPNPLFYLVKA